MRIISEHPAHSAYVRQEGKLKINNVNFVTGELGKAVAFGATEEEVARFCGVDGYTFLHDDGTHAGVSDTYQAKVNTLLSLSAVGDPEALLASLIASGQLTPDMLSRAQGKVTGAPDVAPGTLVDKNGFPLSRTVEVTLPGPVQVSADAAPVVPAAPVVSAATVPGSAPAAPVTPSAGDQQQGEQEQGDQESGGNIDFTDLTQVSGLKRQDLLGAANSYGVAYSVTESNVVIAGKVVEAAQAQIQTA